MQVFAYRNTERGAQHILARRLAEERAKREAAQKVAWDATVALNASAREQVIQLEQVMREVRKQRGAKFEHTYALIERRIRRVFGLTKIAFQSNRRHRRLVLARQCAMYWACRLTRLSLPQIGRLMGGRDHTTILHGKCKYLEKRKAMGRKLRDLG